MKEEPPIRAEDLKESGNKAVKECDFKAAILFYTQAIELDSSNFTLYSNRSYAYLNDKQYYLALTDANETISLNPLWPKGYFRKGEVEYITGHYTDAYDSYREALKLKPDDINLLEALNKTAKEIIKENEADKKIPWVGAGIGIVVGVVIVIADCLFTYKPTHPMLMALITIIIALVGYGIARIYRTYVKYQRNGMLQPPTSLDNELHKTVENGEQEKEVKRTPRYTKSQARQRYKKGKL